MCECIKLKYNNIEFFKQLYESNKQFNILNENFFREYNSSNIIKRLLLMKDVKLLKNQSIDKYLGYIWIKKIEYKTYFIKSLNVKFENHSGKYLYFNQISKLYNNSTYLYLCQKNNYNYEILKNTGFNVIRSSKEMVKVMNQEIFFTYPQDISFHKFIINKDEQLRCNLQNKIFNKNDRVPLNLNDIYFEENQKYYFKDGCYFIKFKTVAIGYGQIIFQDSKPVIVNFGIINSYYKHGYGKCLLIYLLNYLFKLGYKKIYIKVDSKNKTAFSLYSKLGFIENKEISEWQLKR